MTKKALLCFSILALSIQSCGSYKFSGTTPSLKKEQPKANSVNKQKPPEVRQQIQMLVQKA